MAGNTPVRPAGPYEPGYAGPVGPGAAVPVRKRRRRWPYVLLSLLLAAAVVTVGSYFYLDSRLHRQSVLTNSAGTPGTNWLIVGSDSRQGLSKAKEKQLATGNAEGGRTDTMMLLHTGAGGTTLVSLPRDSYVAIPGHGHNKLNAAFAFGGAPLLVRTIEQNTGVHIDHYAEIGFGGFVGIVDSVGGVNMCIKTAMKDKKAGLDLKPGCQTLNGAQALGYVRTRASARADLDRVDHQRQFFAALMKKAGGPGVLLNPFRSIPLALHATDNFTVDKGDHLGDLVALMWTMKSLGSGGGKTTTVPVGGFGSAAGVGSYLRWDPTRAGELFGALKNDTKIPASALAQ